MGVCVGNIVGCEEKCVFLFDLQSLGFYVHFIEHNRHIHEK